MFDREEKITKKEHEDALKAVRELREDDRRSFERQMDRVKHDHELEVESLRSGHALELKEKEFQIKHVADERVLKADEARKEAEKALAVAQTKVESLEKIVDVNADIIDVKELVTQLINKLPEVNITSVIGNANPSGGNKQSDKGKDQSKA